MGIKGIATASVNKKFSHVRFFNLLGIKFFYEISVFQQYTACSGGSDGCCCHDQGPREICETM